MSIGKAVLYPNVTGPIKPRTEMDRGAGPQGPKKNGPAEFDQLLDQLASQQQALDLNEVKQSLKFSGHAMQRLKDRNIEVSPKLMQKMSGAIDRAASKGVEDTLVITPDAAFIVNVKNRTVVTAMDRNNLAENVFTNIDGAVVVS